METPIYHVRLPTPLVEEMRRIAHAESLRRGGKAVSWVRLCAEQMQRFIARYRAREVTAAGVTIDPSGD